MSTSAKVVSVRKSAVSPWLLCAALVVASVLASDSSVSAADPARVIVRGPQTHKTVALTFDDGWSPDRCAEVYDTLVRFDVPATFFPNAVYMGSARKLWRRIAERFPIANHTTHHVSLVGRSADKIRKEIKSQERRIEKLTGRPVSKLLRPPYGAWDERVLVEAGRLGYESVVLWDVSGNDTSPKGTDRGVAKAALRGKPGSIVLMHCGPATTPRVLPLIIARYACRGFRFATVEDLIAGKPGTRAKVACPAPDLPAQGKLAGDVEAIEGPLAESLDDVLGDWRLTHALAGGALEPVASEVDLTLHLEPGKVSGLVDCDVFTARATTAPDGSHALDRLVRSENTCTAPDDAAQASLDALIGGAGVHRDGEALDWLAPDGQTTLRFAPAAISEVLGDWEVTAIADGDGAAVAVEAASPLTLAFEAAGIFTAAAGCDSYLGGFDTRSEGITAGFSTSDAPLCADAADGTKARHLEALGRVASWSLRDDALELRGPDAAIVMELVRRSAD